MSSGPLDELFRWREGRGPASSGPLHERVLEAPTADGEVTFIFVVWRDPGGAAALHANIRRALEATLLAELSRPAPELLDEYDENRRWPTAARVMFFEPIEGIEDALRAFGMRPAADTELGLAQVRGEASRLGFEVEEASAVFETELAHTEGVRDFERSLRSRVGPRVFGSEPGSFFAAYNEALRGLGQSPLAPRAEALDAMEERLVVDRESVIRWVPPIAFQALCDAVGVCAAKDLGRRVDWASSAPEDDGLCPPPMIRIADGPRFAHVALGLDLMRWCVMPKQPGENVPPLSAWLNDRFGG